MRAGIAQVAVLRHLGRLADARLELQRWQAIDPTSNALRYEAVLLGHADADLWPHLAADPDRLIELAVDYLALGFFADAAELLARPLPSGPAVVTEPGMPAASANPLVAYYRAYSRLRAGLPADADFRAAAGKPTTYIFPNRPTTLAVLRAALQHDPTDATASFLLGSLYLSGGRVEPALEAWSAARRQHPRIPGLHRNLALTYLIALERPDQALEIFREGLDVDPQNIGLYVGIDQALSLTGGTATERAAALARYPDTANMPAAVSFKLALALAEAGRFDEADRMFVNRFFASEELGTNVRDVYVEVRLMRAREAARHQQCRDALAVIDRLAEPVEGIPFTRDGLDAFLHVSETPAADRRSGGRLRTGRPCSRALARPRWIQTTLPALDLAFAYRAARDVCETTTTRASPPWIRHGDRGSSSPLRRSPGRSRPPARARPEPSAARKASCLPHSDVRTKRRRVSVPRCWPRPCAVAPPRAEDRAMISCPLHLFRVGSTTSSDASGSPAAGPCHTLPPNVVM